jgi:hypothetical protein
MRIEEEIILRRKSDPQRRDLIFNDAPPLSRLLIYVRKIKYLP